MPTPDPEEPMVPDGLEPVEGDPFDPPADYQFEDELRGPAPRPRTPGLALGRYATGRRRAVSGLLIAAALCTTLGLLPFVQLCGLYILPLAYISWIGIALGALGIWSFVAHRVRKGPYRYVEEGIPIVARIRGLVLRPTAIVNGQPTTHRFFALIEFRDPESGEPRFAEVASADIGAASKDKLTTTYRVGDDATAIYLPGDPGGTLKLYGFLDLKPGLGLIPRDAEPEAGGGLLRLAAILAAAAAFFGVLFWNVYALARYGPIDFDLSRLGWPFGAGAVALGGGMIASMARGARRTRANREARNALALARGEPVEVGTGKRPGWFGDHGIGHDLIILAGCILLGGATTIAWYLSANALLDRSPPRYRPTQVDRLVMVTHSFLLREYKIQYHFLDGAPGKHDLFSTPTEMAGLGGHPTVAEVHAGAFGVPWVKAILPVEDRPGP